MSTTRSGRLTAALLLVAILALGVVALSACGSSDDTTASSSPSAAAAGPITVTDDAGQQVTLDQAGRAHRQPGPGQHRDRLRHRRRRQDGRRHELRRLPRRGEDPAQGRRLRQPERREDRLVRARSGARRRRHPGRPAQQAREARHEGLRGRPDDATTAPSPPSQNIGKLAGTSEQGATAVAEKMTAPRTRSRRRSAARQGHDVPRDLQQAAHDRRLQHVHRRHDQLAGGTNIGATAGSGFPNFSTEVLAKMTRRSTSPTPGR